MRIRCVYTHRYELVLARPAYHAYLIFRQERDRKTLLSFYCVYNICEDNEATRYVADLYTAYFYIRWYFVYMYLLICAIVDYKLSVFPRSIFDNLQFFSSTADLTTFTIRKIQSIWMVVLFLNLRIRIIWEYIYIYIFFLHYKNVFRSQVTIKCVCVNYSTVCLIKRKNSTTVTQSVCVVLLNQSIKSK